MATAIAPDAPPPVGAAPDWVAGAGAVCGVKIQLGRPLASVSNRTSGLLRISRTISIRLPSSGISASCRSIFPIAAMSGREKPDGFDNVTSEASIVGLSDHARPIFPLICRSRPVACFTAATIWGLYVSGSKVRTK